MTMNNELPHLHDIRHVSLSDHERAHMRGTIKHFMISHPFSASSVLVDLTRFVLGHRLMVACASLVIIIAGLAAAAGRSVPGDYLYARKIEIEDSLTNLFTSSPESEIEWDLNVAERRMQEIEQLATDLGW